MDASPKPNKSRDAPPPSPKRAKKPSPPAHDKEAEVEAPPEADALKPSGEIVASPKPNKKRTVMEEEERAAGADEAEGVVESGEASPMRNAEAASSPQHKTRGAMSPVPKRGKKPGSDEEELETAEKEDSGKARPGRAGCDGRPDSCCVDAFPAQQEEQSIRRPWPPAV